MSQEGPPGLGRAKADPGRAGAASRSEHGGLEQSSCSSAGDWNRAPGKARMQDDPG
jgi:hypothetical protein